MATITEQTARMHHPVHPGEILHELYLAPLKITITRAAEALGVSRKHVSSIIHGRAPVTPGMAMRLAAALDTDPELWLNLQAQYDLWEARHSPPPRVQVLTRAVA